jgi:raffinose/stachyose/melibiose transport system permease protein
MVIYNIILLLISQTCIFPLIWILYSSFKSRKEFSINIINLPSQLNFENYLNAIKVSHIEIFFKNSLIISILTTIIVVVIGFITGYLLSRFVFKGRNALYTLFIAGILVPVHSLLIPLFVQFNRLGMLDKRITLILTYAACNLPLTIFLVESFVKTIPREMEEAAFIDGSTISNTMFRIIMPMTTPVLATSTILTFLDAWNEFPFATVLIKSKDLKTIPVGMANFSGEFSVNYTQLMAASVLALAGNLGIFIVFQ